MAVKAFFRLVRWPNLVIVILTQYLLEYRVLRPAFQASGIQSALDHFQFSVLVLFTVSVAAGGYIVNDICDVDVDRINRPGKQTVRTIFTNRQAWNMYLVTNLFAFLSAVFLAATLENSLLLLIFFVTAGLLYGYSQKFKKEVLTGNLIVALLCALVAGVIWIAEYSAFENLPLIRPGEGRKLRLVFAGYMSFAFLSTLYREIIKDLEDMKGDKIFNYKTLPVISGEKIARRAAFTAGFMLFILLGLALFLEVNAANLLNGLTLSVALLLPLGYSFFYLLKARRKEDYSFLSKLTKWIMLAGIFYILLL